MPELNAAALLRALTPPKETHQAVRQRMRQAAVDLVAQDELLAPAFSFQIVELDVPATETLKARREQLYAPRLLPVSGQLTALACGVATIGPRLEQRVGSLFKERRPSLALALDAIGNELLFAAVRCLQDRILMAVRKRGLTMAGELRPGDPGLSIDTQDVVLRLAGADKIGVHVTRGWAIHPLKSSSQVLGVGVDLPPAHWSRCDDCRSRATCKLAAQEAARAANKREAIGGLRETS